MIAISAMPRLASPRDPVTVLLDGEPVVAQRGEPVAAALVAAGYLALARSPKFHRPRGPACMRAACDGCLARVDGEPNVMTCRVPAAEGTRVETQNVVGSRKTDLLRMADWFFPEGMNHHELFAGVPGVQNVMQAFARRVAGLGRLPKDAPPAREARRRDVDVLVVGSGPSGMAVATQCARKGRGVEVLEEDLVWGGSLRAMPGADREPWEPLRAAFGELVSSGRVVLRAQTAAAGVYRGEVLVAGSAGIEVVHARSLVLAPGAHDGVLAFEGNDLPGVMSARAGTRLLAEGVVPGARVVVAIADGAPYGDVFGRACAELRAECEVVVVRGTPVRARGTSRVRDVTVATEAGEQQLACDVLLVDARRAPAYELCAQAGATLEHERRGFVTRAPRGKIKPGVFAAGEVVGTPLRPDAVWTEAKVIAEQT
jgi:sarcosine oxidase subunit alpha